MQRVQDGHKSGTTSTTQVDYKLESERLKTFKHWKSNLVRAEDLAKAGFYCLNNPTTADLVKCAFCHAELCKWKAGDDALQEHIRWSPTCPFAKEKSGAAEGRDVCGTSEMFPNSVPESEVFRLLSSMVKDYGDPKVRLESFANWPSSSKQKPAAMAEAGFYYRGVEDHTICFSCGGALKDWRDDNDPWQQHAMWFPQCKYLVANRSAEYIREVQNKLNDVISSAKYLEELENKFKSVPSAGSSKEEPQECTSASEQSSSSSSGHPQECKTASEQSSGSFSGRVTLRCKICRLKNRNVIFIPCQHILTCNECSRKISNCSECGQPIGDRIEIFLP